MGSFKGNYDTRAYTSRTVITLADLSYTTNEGVTHTVLKGFITDGASIPRIFWSLIGSPFTGLYRKPSLVHDKFYATQKVTRKYADRIFLEGMKDEGVSWWRRKTMYFAVRAGAYFIWKRHAKRLKKEDKK